MSGLVMGLVWELPITEAFKRAEKYILLAYADHADQDGRNVYPAIELVSRKTGYEERAVQMATRALVSNGYLVPDGVGPHGTNRWRIPVVRSEDGGAKIAPLPKMQKNAPEGNAPLMQKNAPEGIAPEGNAPEPLNTNTETEREKAPAPKKAEAAKALTQADFYGMTVSQAYAIPSLQVFRDATGRFPGAGQWWTVHQRVTAEGLTVAQIRTVYEQWCARGYRPENIDFLLYAKDGNIPTKRTVNYANTDRKSGGKSAPAIPTSEPSDADRAAAERVRARKAGL